MDDDEKEGWSTYYWTEGSFFNLGSCSYTLASFERLELSRLKD